MFTQVQSSSFHQIHTHALRRSLFLDKPFSSQTLPKLFTKFDFRSTSDLKYFVVDNNFTPYSAPPNLQTYNLLACKLHSSDDRRLAQFVLHKSSVQACEKINPQINLNWDLRCLSSELQLRSTIERRKISFVCLSGSNRPACVHNMQTHIADSVNFEWHFDRTAALSNRTQVFFPFIRIPFLSVCTFKLDCNLNSV